MKKEIVIFGSSEIASLARYYFEHDSDFKVVAFTVDDSYVSENSLEGVPVVPFSETCIKYPPSSFGMHVALSYRGLNKLRQEKYAQGKRAGYEMVTYINSHLSSWPDLQIGENCFILENQTIQPTVKIGHNVVLWSGNHLGHGSQIGSHTYLASHVVIAGHCKIGERCFLGINCSVKDFTEIGDDCFVGMNAAVTKSLPDGSVALGQPAEIYLENDRRARVIKAQFFR
ncbi:acetyltransferase [bacterium]|nr:acetyltransferase [bacterium]